MKKIQLINNFSQKKKARVSSRERLFKDLIYKLDAFDLFDATVGDVPDFIVYFDSDLIKRKNGEKPIVELLQYKELDDTQSILDVTNDVFDDDKLGPVLTLCVVCAGLITCSSSYLQERIYENTGRLALIVNDPVKEEDLDPPDLNETKNIEEPLIVWFGLISELFTIRKEQVKNQSFKIKTIVATQDTDKKIKNSIERADILYFPKAFNTEGEESRVLKVKSCLKKGKFVVAPNLPLHYCELAYNGSLQQAVDFYQSQNIQKWITDKQNKILQFEGEQNSLQQLERALNAVPDEDFLDNLDYFLETEEIKI